MSRLHVHVASWHHLDQPRVCAPARSFFWGGRGGGLDFSCSPLCCLFCLQVFRLVDAGQQLLVEMVADNLGLDLYMTGGIEGMTGKAALFLLKDERIEKALETLDEEPSEDEEELAAIAEAARIAKAEKLALEAEEAEREKEQLAFVLEETEKRCAKLEQDMFLMQKRAETEREFLLNQMDQEMERLKNEASAHWKVARAKTASANLGRGANESAGDASLAEQKRAGALPGATVEEEDRGGEAAGTMQASAADVLRMSTAPHVGEAAGFRRPVTSGVTTGWMGASRGRLNTAPAVPARRPDSAMERKIVQDPIRILGKITEMRGEVESLEKELVRCKTAEARSKLSPEELAAQHDKAERAKMKRLNAFQDAQSHSAAATLGLGDGSRPRKGGGIYSAGVGKKKASPSWL